VGRAGVQHQGTGLGRPDEPAEDEDGGGCGTDDGESSVHWLAFPDAAATSIVIGTVSTV